MVTGISILHAWYDYKPGHFDLAHPYCLAQPDLRSTLVCARLIDPGEGSLAGAHWVERVGSEAFLATSFVRRVADRAFEPIFDLRFNRLAASWANAAKATVVHVHFGTTGARLLPFLRRTKIPALVSFYGFDASGALRSSRIRAAYRELFDRVDLVLVLCGAVKDRLVDAGCDERKIRLFNLPGDVEKYDYRPRTSTGSTRFIMAARFVEKKGQRYALDALARILSTGKRATLTLLGYGSMRGAIEQHVRDLGIEQAVRIVDTKLLGDFTTVYRKELAEHDVFVLPSTTAANGDDEGGPALTMIAAQAAGLPVICTPFVGAERSLDDGVEGILCAQDDAGSLAEAMTLLLDAPDEWNRLGGAGSARVRAQFAYDRQVKTLAGYYRELSNRPT